MQRLLVIALCTTLALGSGWLLLLMCVRWVTLD